MNSFIYNPGEMGGEIPGQPRFLIVRDGKVTPIYSREEWREGLRYLNRLYTQGVIDPQIFTQDEDALQRLGNNPDDVILGGVLGGSAGSAVSIEGTPGARWAEYISVPPVAGPEVSAMRRGIPTSPPTRRPRSRMHAKIQRWRWPGSTRCSGRRRRCARTEGRSTRLALGARRRDRRRRRAGAVEAPRHPLSRADEPVVARDAAPLHVAAHVFVDCRRPGGNGSQPGESTARCDGEQLRTV